MKLSKLQKKALKYLFADGNEVAFIENLIKIRDKNGKLVPFKLTKQQKDFVENMGKESIILKSRQLGFSVVSLALMLRKAILKPHSSSKIFSFEGDSATDNFEKLKAMYENLPQFIKDIAQLDINNREQLKFSNGSFITCKTIGTSNKGKGKGSTINGFLHLTEFSYYSNASDHLASLSKAVSSGGKIIIESTANGVANFFYKMYMEAKNKENGYKPFFFNWVNGRELFEEDYKLAVEKYKSINGKDLTEKDLDDEEKELIKIGATLDQLTWRRFEVVKDGIKKFHQERPATEQEAFLTTGETLFDSKRIDILSKTLMARKKSEKYLPKHRLNNLPSELKSYYGDEFKVYHDVKEGQRYYIGVDMGEGVGQDYNVVVVYNTDFQECAMFRSNTLKPHTMAEIINIIGRYYNKAFIVVEKASGGYTVLEKLVNDFNYSRLYQYFSYDEKNRKIRNIGFDTNGKTKGIAIRNFVERFENGDMEVNSIEVLDEMKVFQVDKNGKMGAMNGFHDDTIMATAICLYALKQGDWWRW